MGVNRGEGRRAEEWETVSPFQGKRASGDGTLKI